MADAYSLVEPHDEEDDLDNDLPLAELSLLLDQGRDHPELLQATLLHDLQDSSSSSSSSGQRRYRSILSAAVQPALLSSKLQPLQDRSRALQYLLLKACAGLAGPHSLSELERVLQQIRSHNWSLQQEPGCPGRHFLIDVAEVREEWFLRRSPLGLLMSKVRVWGPGGDQLPGQPLPPGVRAEMVQLLLAAAAAQTTCHLVDGPGVKERLLTAVNRNLATPFFTGCHFCELDALSVLCREVTWRLMLTGTKRGEEQGASHCTTGQQQQLQHITILASLFNS
jgi:hypothetical protein